jgi:putative endonuclease
VLEWPIRHAWRACVAARLPWVRIPPSPPAYAKASAGKSAPHIMWYVYILKSSIDNNLYIGSTNDIKRRLAEHNSGKVDSTKTRVPLKLEACFSVKDKVKAVKLEQYFKTGSGRAFLNKRIL